MIEGQMPRERQNTLFEEFLRAHRQPCPWGDWKYFDSLGRTYLL